MNHLLIAVNTSSNIIPPYYYQQQQYQQQYVWVMIHSAFKIELLHAWFTPIIVDVLRIFCDTFLCIMIFFHNSTASNTNPTMIDSLYQSMHLSIIFYIIKCTQYYYYQYVPYIPATTSRVVLVLLLCNRKVPYQ